MRDEGTITRCKRCRLAIQERAYVLEMAAASTGQFPRRVYWAHFTEAAYFVGGYHEPEPMKWLREDW